MQAICERQYGNKEPSNEAPSLSARGRPARKALGKRKTSETPMFSIISRPGRCDLQVAPLQMSGGRKTKGMRLQLGGRPSPAAAGSGGKWMGRGRIKRTTAGQKFRLKIGLARNRVRLSCTLGKLGGLGIKNSDLRFANLSSVRNLDNFGLNEGCEGAARRSSPLIFKPGSPEPLMGVNGEVSFFAEGLLQRPETTEPRRQP